MMKVRTLIFGVLAMGLVVGVVGMAQVTQGSTAQFTVPTLIRLALSTSTINFGALTIEDYDAGYKHVAGAQDLRVWSNVEWLVSVTANDKVWAGPWAKPVSDLQWQASSKDPRVAGYVGTLTGLSVDETKVAWGTRGGNIALSMDFRVLVSWENDPAGDYSVGFTYTLTAP